MSINTLHKGDDDDDNDDNNNSANVVHSSSAQTHAGKEAEVTGNSCQIK
jgi:hypothetical protein